MDSVRDSSFGLIFLHINCCHLRKIYDDATNAISPEFALLLNYTKPELLLITETKLGDLQVALRMRAATGFDKVTFVAGVPQGTPHGLLAFWKFPLKSGNIHRGIDWLLIEFGYGMALAYVYSAPYDRGSNFVGLVGGWADSYSRLLLVGDINPSSNGTATVPAFLRAGLARVPCEATTRGTRPNRPAADQVWCSAQHARKLVAVVIIRPYYVCLSDYHWPVAIRVPPAGFMHTTAPGVTWRAQMTIALRNPFRPADESLMSLVSSAREANPRPPTTGVHFNIGNLTSLFYKAPSQYATILFGHATYTAADNLNAAARAEILTRANTRYTSNPRLSDSATALFIQRHVDPHYPRDVPQCDAELMRVVGVQEVHATIEILRDAATQDLGITAVLTLMATDAHTISSAFSTWITAGRCLEPLILALAYQVIAKRGKITVSQHRVIVIERALGRLWYKVLERRLRRAIDTHDILSSNNVAFCTDRSANEVLILLKTLIDSERAHQPCYIATSDWPSAYDYLNWGLCTHIGERIMGARRFFELIVMCFRDAPRTLYVGPNDEIGTLAQATNGGPQGNCVLPLLWNIYVDPLARALKALNPPSKPAAATVFCDDNSAYCLNLGAVRAFFDTIDTYTIDTGSPLGKKNAIAANAAGTYVARTQHHITHLGKQRGDPVLIEGSITFLGACLHLDKAYPCSTRECKYCNAPSPCKVCDTCMGTFLLNLKHSPLSPLNRASLVKCYIFQPLLQQVWLCPFAIGRYLAWGTGPGSHLGVRGALHNNPIGGPWNESLELDVRMAGAGLGNMQLTLAKGVISDFARCAYGPSDAARALTTMWRDRGNLVVRQALRDLRGTLQLRDYPTQRYIDKWRFAHRTTPRIEGKTILVTWTQQWGEPKDGIFAIAVGTPDMTLGASPQAVITRSVHLISTRDRAEAELAAVWAALLQGDNPDTHVIASTPQAVTRIGRYRNEIPRGRRKLAYGLWLEAIAQKQKSILTVEDCGRQAWSLEWLARLPIPGLPTLNIDRPAYIVQLTLPYAGIRQDRLHSALNAECKERAKRAMWEKMQASLGDAAYRVPSPGGHIDDLGWAQAARVTFTKQTKLACCSPLGAGDVIRIINLRFAGYHKVAIMGTTKCLLCGLLPFTLTHLLELPRYAQALNDATRTYGQTLRDHGVPLWWLEWDRPDGPLLSALGWVPGSVERAMEPLKRHKPSYDAIAAAVLDVQLCLVKALLTNYAEHGPTDARPLAQRANGPNSDLESGAHTDPEHLENDMSSPLVSRTSRRAQGRPTIDETRAKYGIREDVLVLFDGAARHTCSGSAVVVIFRGDVYRFAYRHPSHRTASLGERIGFVLAILALRRLRSSVRGTCQEIPVNATVAYIGDNETLMRQVGIAGLPRYKSKGEITRRTTEWLRFNLSPSDGVYHVQREHNWLPDETADKALDAWVATRSRLLTWSTEFGRTQDMIDEVERTWGEIDTNETLPEDRAAGVDHDQASLEDDSTPPSPDGESDGSSQDGWE